jgi:GntR family transcriptional regulator, histidine utilization repressor
VKTVSAQNGSQPRYRQVKNHVLANIRSGGWPPGTRIPSENELAARFGIARMTANRALRELTRDGYISRVPGVGTFVKEIHRSTSLLELRNIADEIAARGRRYDALVISLAKVKADRQLAQSFDLKTGATLYALTIVHREDGVPVQLERRYVNPSVAPFFLRQDFSATTPTAYLLSLAPVHELEHSVKAVLPDHAARKLLRLTSRAPCLELHRTSWSGGKVVTRVTLTYPAGRYELVSRYRTSASGALPALTGDD